MGKDKREKSTKMKVKKRPGIKHKKLKKFYEDRQLKNSNGKSKGSWFK